MRSLKPLARVGCGLLAALWLVGPAFAQPAPDWIKITPPPGMRWKSRDQSSVTNDFTFVDTNGDTWLRKSAAATFSSTFVLVQLVGDTGGTDLWMELVDDAPKYLHLRPDPDWSQPEYLAFTSTDLWRGMIKQQRVNAFLVAGSNGMATPDPVILPVYRSASTGRPWATPDDGPFPADAQLTGEFLDNVPRVKAGVDTPYTVDVQDFSTDPPSVETRPGGYELYRNYSPRFNPDGSWTLVLDGDFSFQKDYLFPTGGPLCYGGLPRMPDGTCVEQPTTDPPSVGTSQGPGTDGTPPPSTLDNPPLLVPPVSTTTSPAPLTRPGVPGDGCSGPSDAYIDLCGEARSRAAGLGAGLGLPQLTLHANPERGLMRVPTWLWADGAGYSGGPVTGVAGVDLPWIHDWDTCSTDQETGETQCEHHHDEGTYHLSLSVRFQPGRYVWSFGDRSRLDTGSLGLPYPAESDVQHVYRDTSLGQPEDLYTIGLDVDWVGDWSVSGDATGQGGLSGRRTTYRLPYAVREAQAVRCPSDSC